MRILLPLTSVAAGADDAVLEIGQAGSTATTARSNSLSLDENRGALVHVWRSLYIAIRTLTRLV